jgi:hypothetical protein
MTLNRLIAGSLAALALAGSAALAADAYHHRTTTHRSVTVNRTVHRDVTHRNVTVNRDVHRNVVVNRNVNVHRTYITTDRVVDVFRTRHIRYVGTPYLSNGYYVVQCYDASGRLEYCRVDPYSGAFVGFSIHL